MYSIVLMAALTTGAASEGCCWGHAYCGCYGGGYGGCYGGCYGGGYGGCYGGCYGGGVNYVPTTGPGNGAGKVVPEKLDAPKKQDDTTRAKVLIDVPAQAKLYIDDQPMSNKTGLRTFVTPPLQRGQSYFYDVKIVLTVDGQEKVQTQRVILRAGEVVAANFSAAPSGTATAQADPR